MEAESRSPTGGHDGVSPDISVVLLDSLDSPTGIMDHKDTQRHNDPPRPLGAHERGDVSCGLGLCFMWRMV